MPKTGLSGARLALRREPSTPKPPPWGDVAILDYEKLIQPIMVRHCVRCHGEKESAKGLELSAALDPYGFVQSYRSLFGIRKDMPTPLGEGYREAYAEIPNLEAAEGGLYEAVKAGIYTPGGLLCLSNHMSGPEVTQPKQFGSHCSRLVLSLLNDEAHRKDMAGEVGVVVRDDFQGRGVGTELLSYLTYLAKRQGLLGFTAEVLVENRPMMNLFEKMGFDIEKRRSEYVYELEDGIQRS